MSSIIVCEFHCWKHSRPFIQIVCAKYWNVSFDFLIYLFCCPIRLWVICSCQWWFGSFSGTWCWHKSPVFVHNFSGYDALSNSVVSDIMKRYGFTIGRRRKTKKHTVTILFFLYSCWTCSTLLFTCVVSQTHVLLLSFISASTCSWLLYFIHADNRTITHAYHASYMRL